jgi:hypothetical protein
MKWACSGTSVALVAILTCGACGSFGAESAGTDAGADAADAADAGDAGDAALSCLPETCAGAGPSCFFDDFEAGCRSEIQFSGDDGMPTVVGGCAGGRLRVAARNTLDMTAQLSLTAPDTYDSIRVSVGLAVAEWQMGPVLRIGVGGTLLASLDVAKVKSGNPAFSLCGEGGAGCIAPAFEMKAGEVHRFTFDITRTAVTMSVDCKLLATRTVAVTLAARADVGMAFGKVDANPIDGTLDDLSVSFP